MKKRVLSLMLVVTLLASILSSGMLSATAAISPTTGSANDGVDFTALMAGNIYLGKYNHATSFATTTYGLATKEAIATPVLWKVMGEEQTNDNLDAGANTTGDGNLTLMSRYVLDSAVYSKGTVYTAPYVASHPADISVTAGSNAAFTVVYTGVAPTYQWQLDTGSGFADIASATAATYTATAVTAGQNGYKYRCVLKKTGQADAISNAATLSVVASAPVVRTNPNSVGKAVGQSAVFTVLQGGGVVSFQWKVSTDGGASFTPIAGATAATYVIPYVSSSDNGKLFQCAITSSLGTATSSNAALYLLTSNPQPIFAISNIRDFLNNNFNDTNAFNGAEYSSIPTTSVVNRYINTSNRTERIVSDYSGFYWPNTTSQKLYIPSGFNMTGLANKLSWGASESVVKNIAGGSGVASDVKNSVDTSTNFALGKLKGATTQYVNYYTKTVYGSGFTFVNMVSGGVNPTFSVTTANVAATDYGKLQGVRPAFKLDPAKIVYANKITAAGNGYEVGTTEGDNYKLTLVQGDSGTLNLSNLKKDNVSLSNNQTVSVAPNSTLNLTGSTSLTENNVMYKIVDSNHNIVSYGEAAAPGSTSISIPSTNLSGNYNLYLWEQQSNSNISNVASNPINLLLQVASYVPVEQVIVTPETATIGVGGTETLSAEVLPLNASDKAVLWTSSNESVATVSSNGTVTAISQGTAIITATSVDNNLIKDTCEISVIVKIVDGVSLNKTTTTIFAGLTETLVATVSPSDAYDKSVIWESTNQSVATVNQSGVVTAVAPGTTTIRVTTNDGGFVATCVVTVPTRATGVILNKSSTTISIGGSTEMLIATVAPENTTDKTVTWSSSNNSIATVSSNGVVSAVAVGIATITVRTNDGNFTAQCTVTVNDTAVVDVIALINALPNPAKISNLDQVETARAAYNALTATQMTNISTTDYAKLLLAEEQVYGRKLVLTSSILNSGYEDGKSPWGGSLSYVTTDATNVHNGTTALEMVANSGTWQFVSLKPNTTYVVKAWVKVQGLSGDRVLLRVKDYNGTEPDIDNYSYSTYYTEVSNTFTTGSNPTNVNITIYKLIGDGAGKAWADDVSLYEVVAPNVNFADYNVSESNIITNVQPNLSQSQFLSGLLINKGNGSLTDANGDALPANAKVGTGMMFKLNVDGVITFYTIVVYGDVDGDGSITAIDLVCLKRHLLKTNSLTGANLIAAKIAKKDSVSISDLMSVKKHILGISTISQG